MLALGSLSVGSTAAQGDPASPTRGEMIAMGFIYALGRDVPQDHVQAAAWFRKAATLESPRAQNILGTMYAIGCGVPKDPAQTVAWFARRNEVLRNARDDPNSWFGVFDQDRGTVASFCKVDRHSVDGIILKLRATVMVPLQLQGGTYVVPVRINNSLTLHFTVDSGAAHVGVPADVVMTLLRTGTLRQTDFLSAENYSLADGSTMTSKTFRIRSLMVGDKIVEGVTGNVAPVNGSLLLGQSFLSRFTSWSMDNTKHLLILE
jgi:predicted aspartyl protease